LIAFGFGGGRRFMLDFFFYGTLLDPDIRRLVLRRDVPSDRIFPATLAGYRRFKVFDAPYPAAIRHPGAEIDGSVVRGLDALDAGRLDNFEGDDYFAALCPVKLSGGESGDDGPEEVWVFIATDRVPLTQAAWSLDAWQLTDKRDFIDVAHDWLEARGNDEIAVRERMWRARLASG
jgi:Gamma-glutamyl cyclotransferase, AIG2-like